MSIATVERNPAGSQRKLKLTKSYVKPLTLDPGTLGVRADMMMESSILVKVCTAPIPLDTYRQCATCSIYCI